MTRRSPSPRRGRTCCCSSRSSRRSPSRAPSLGSLWADRLALAYGAVVVVYWLLPQSWLGGEATTRGELYALRHHLLPLGAYLLGRLVTLDRALVAAGRAHGRRRRGRARGLGARRRLPRAAPVVARLGCSRLVLRAARAHLPLPVGPSGELDPEHGRGEPCAPAGVDVPQPARHRVRARRRAPPARCAQAAPVDDRRRGRRLRGPALDAHARGVHRAAGRPARARRAPPRRGCPRRSRPGPSRRRSCSSPSSRRSGRPRRTRRPSSPACGRTRPSRAKPRTTRSRAARAPPRAT